MENKDKRSYVYMLTNRWGNVLYVGSTEDLKTRLDQHRRRVVPGFTEKYNVDKLVYFEEHSSLESAQAREKYLKGKTRAKKNAVVESTNPDWNDLSANLA